MTTETAPQSSAPPASTRQPIMAALQDNLRDYGLVLALLAIMVFFQFATNGVLFKPVNLTNVVLQNSYIIIMALGMLLVIVAGHIDLSVGSVSGFIGAIAAIMMVTYKMDPISTGVICLAAGGIIGAAQGYWIAYHKIPSFIVTLAGMLVFKGLSLAVLGGASVGPFPAEFQLLSAGFIPDVIGPMTLIAPTVDAAGKVVAGSGVVLHSTTVVIGLIGIAAYLYFGLQARRNREAHGYSAEPFALYVIKTLVIAGLVLFLTYTMASYKGLPNVLVVMSVLIALFVFLTMKTTLRAPHLRDGWQPQGSGPVGYQDRATDILCVRHHGRAVSAGRPDLCGAPQHCDPEGRAGLRARRDRRRVHRRCVSHGWRRPGGRCRDRRVHHGRDEQRHVDPWRQHRLAAGDQGPGTARRRGVRRLQQKQGLIPQPFSTGASGRLPHSDQEPS